MKRLLDMLFEPEETIKEEVIVEAPLEDVRISTQKKPEEKMPILQEKPVIKKTSQSFINLEELQQRKPKTSKVEQEKPKQVYEFRKPLSPVFGYVDKGDKKDFVLHTPQINNDASSALGTIISPYFGVKTPKKIEEKKEIEVISKPENHNDILPREDISSIESRIVRKMAEELPISSLLHKPEEKAIINDMSEADITIADTEISLFDELFRTEEE